ncbi:hypothetical protein IDH21_00970 [Pelagibacterales bacterium SAG-MED47]|nr:hypothetical protein [Pelagibacterales bacterium SAG-MED47]
MFSETIFKKKIIKLFLIFSYITCWLSISTSADDLLIIGAEFDFNPKILINFLRHASVYASLFFLFLIIFFYKKIFFSKKNFIFLLFIIYLFFQLPGLFFSENSIKNISYVVSSLTVVFIITLKDHFFLSKEKIIFIIISFILLSVVFAVTFIPHFFGFLKGGDYFYGFLNQSPIFLDKLSPRSSGLARTSLILLLFLYVFEVNLFKKKIFFFTILKILLLTCILLLQSRTIIFLTVFSYFFIFLFEYKFSLKNISKFLFTFLIIPIIFMLFLSYVNQYKQYQDKKIQNSILLNETMTKKFTEFMKYSNEKNSPRKLRSLSPDASSGRIQDWTGILKSVSGKGFFFGYGSQGDRYLINQSASNGLIYAYSSSGIFGLIILISFSTFVLFRSIKVMAYNYKSHKDFYIYSLMVLVILLRSILETSYTVFSIDFIILITLLGIINENKINIRKIKNKFLNDKS